MSTRFLSLRTAPPWIRWGGVLFIGVLLVFALFLAKIGGSVYRNASASVDRNSQPQRLFKTHPEDAHRLTKVVARTRDLTAHLAGLRKTTRSINRRLDDLIETHDAENTMHSKTTQRLDGQAMLLTRLRERVSRLFAAKARKPRIQPARIQPMRKIPPPELVAIDFWDGEPIAVLRCPAGLLQLRQNERGGGWWVKSIDGKAARVDLQNARGEQVSLRRG